MRNYLSDSGCKSRLFIVQEEVPRSEVNDTLKKGATYIEAPFILRLLHKGFLMDSIDTIPHLVQFVGMLENANLKRRVWQVVFSKWQAS